MSTINNFWHLFSGPPFLFVIFVSVIIFVAIMSMIFMYHWRTYGIEQRIIQRIQVIYFSGAVVVISVALMSLIVV